MRLLLHGGDPGLADAEVARAIASVQAGHPDVEVLRLDGETVEDRHLLNALAMPSLFATHRLVIVTGLASRLSKGEAPAKVAAAKGGPPVGSVDPPLRRALDLGLKSAGSGIDVIMCEREALAKTHPLVAAITEAGGEVQTVGFVNANNFAGVIEDLARELGVSMTDGAVARLTERCRSEFEVNGRLAIQPDVLLARSEVLKLATYTNGARAVMDADVKLLVDEPAELVWAFTDALVARDLAKAQRELNDRLERGEVPQVLFALVTAQVRRLLLCLASFEETGRIGDVNSAGVRISQYQMSQGRMLEHARAFGMDGLVAAMRLMVRADEAIKTGRLDVVDVLPLVVASLCTRTDLLPATAGQLFDGAAL